MGRAGAWPLTQPHCDPSQGPEDGSPACSGWGRGPARSASPAARPAGGSSAVTFDDTLEFAGGIFTGLF